MDYNYLSLLQQIKALQNNNHVISSNRSKSTEELSNGSLTLLVDVIKQYFSFRCTGIADPIYIDPVNHQILNVTYINGVDVSRLISGITKGYGINITDKGEGIYEVAVIDKMFALSTELDEVDSKFNNYTTTEDLVKSYATIAKVEEVDSKFINYTTTEDLVKNYATIAKVEEVDSKFDNYTTTEDLEENYMKKTDIVPSTDSQFDVVNGFPKYYVRNEHLVQRTDKLNDLSATYNILTITPPSEVTNQIVQSSGRLNVFKVIFRKNVIYDNEGKYTKEFVIYVENQKVYCPVITLNDDCMVDYMSLSDNSFFFACDAALSFDPFTLYKHGELSIMYLLSTNSLLAKQPTIKCDIIEAKNALTLHESDIYYLYKPSIITEEPIDYTYRVFNTDTSNYEERTEQIDCYKMVYILPPLNEYDIPINQPFSFTEHCFGNTWSLLWSGSSWTGNNVSGRSNGKIVNSKLSLRVDKKYNDYGCSGCYVRCKHDEWNGKFIDNTNFMKGMFSFGKTRLLYKDGSIADGSTQRIDIERYSNVDAYNEDGYDYLPLYLRINNADEDVVKELLNKVDKILLDMTFNGAVNRLSFRFEEIHKDQNFGYYIDLIGELDSIEKINYYWNYSYPLNERNIVLYLRKDYTDPIEEVNWNSTTNAFDYIIQQQYYEILPNPNAATTLYTDYNITSSKIITADNITTMRSDLNLVTNTVDVVSYDVKDIRSNVDILNSQMAEQKQVTDCLKKDVEQNRVIAYTALAFGIAGTVGSAASIGMQLGTKGIQFASKNGYQFLSCCAAEPAEVEMNGTSMLVGELDLMGTILNRSIVTDITPVLNWCNEEYIAIPDIVVDDEARNPKTTACSLYTTIDMCNRFRETLKPVFKKLANRVNELTEEVKNIDITDQLNQKLNDYVTLAKLAECVKVYDLVREDTIDVYANVDNEHHVIIFTFEDNIIDGLIIFKTFATYNGNNRQRRFYIKLSEGQIVDYKGVQTDTTIDGIVIKGLAQSESDRVNYMPTAELIMDSSERFISININETYLITGVIIEQCTCVRQMVYTTKDFAYIQDIDAINKRINALAEQSHMNDTQALSLVDDYATIEEVNEVLTNNYVQKKDLPEPVDLTNYYDKAYIKENYVDYNELDNILTSYCYSKADIEDGMYWKQHIDANFALKTSIPDMTNYYNKGEIDTLIDSNCYSKDYIDDNIYTTRQINELFVLKEEYEELQQKITALEQQLQATKPYYTWATFYTGYTKLDMIDATTSINRLFYYYYNKEQEQIRINHNNSLLSNSFNDFLCIIQQDDFSCHYFRISFKERKVYLNEIMNEGIDPFLFSTNSTTMVMYNINITVPDSSTKQYFKEVYGKYT